MRADPEQLLEVPVDVVPAAGLNGEARTQDAVLHCLTVIGEALGVLTPGMYRQLESLPPNLPKGQRNILVHEYRRVDLDIVWATITADLPSLRADIDRAYRTEIPEM